MFLFIDFIFTYIFGFADRAFYAFCTFCPSGLLLQVLPIVSTCITPKVFKLLTLMCKWQLFKCGCSLKKCDRKRQQLLFQEENCLLSFHYSFKDFLKTIQSHWQYRCAARKLVEKYKSCWRHSDCTVFIYSRHYKVFKPFDIILTRAPEILSNFKWYLNNILLLCTIHNQGCSLLHTFLAISDNPFNNYCYLNIKSHYEFSIVSMHFYSVIYYLDK